MKTTTVKIGDTFYATYADGNSLWEVISSEGKDVWLCEVAYDSDWEGTKKVFMSSEIIAAIEYKKNLQSLFSDHDRFYANLKHGQTVHYINGFDNWVRCVVIKKDGKTALMPTFLLGSWQEYDLPYRRPDGTINLSYYAEKIAKGETFTPNASTLFEFENGYKPRNGIDPNTYHPLDLSVPPMTADQQKVADLWQKVYKVKDSIDGNNPAEILATIRQLVN